MPQKPIVRTAIVADDHAIVRQGTRQILEQIEGLNLVAEAENGIAAIAAVKQHTPDLFVLDAAMPLAGGVEVFGLFGVRFGLWFRGKFQVNCCLTYLSRISLSG